MNRYTTLSRSPSVLQVIHSRTIGALVIAALLFPGGAAPAECQKVEPRASLPAVDRSLDAVVEPLYRLGGTVADDAWQQFRNIRDVAFDGRGSLYLFDQGASAVRVVGPDGTLVRSIGRKGDGPGELSAATGMAVAPDGTLAVYDTGRRSVALFGPDGGYLHNVELDRSRAIAGPEFLDGTGNAFGAAQLGWSGRLGTSEFTPWIRTGQGQQENPPGVPLLRMPLDGGEGEVIAWTWIPERSGADGQLHDTAFLPRVHWALMSDGSVAVTDSIDYRIAIIGGDGEVRLIERPLPPLAVSRAHHKAEIEARLRETGGTVGAGAAGMGDGPREATREMRRQRRAQLEADLHFYPEHQVVRGIRADRENRIWVERVGSDPFTPGPIDVVTASGRYLGSVAEGLLELPRALGPDGLAVWLTRDELDVPVVSVGRIILGI